MQHRQQRRHQQRQNGIDLRRRLGPHSSIAGAQPHQQLDCLDLSKRAARQHAPVIADQITQRMNQPGFTIQPTGAAISEQQPGGSDRSPARNFGQLVFGAADIAIEPVGGGIDGMQRATAERAIGPRQNQGRVDQPVEQAMCDIARVPRWRAIGARICGQPAAQNAFGNRGALLPRGTCLQIRQPAKSVYQPFERRRQSWPGEFDIGDRRFQPVQQKMAGTHRCPGARITRQRIGDRCCQARRNGFCKGVQRAPTDAQMIGQPDQAFARADLRRRKIGQREGTTGLDHAWLNEIGFNQIGLKRVAVKPQFHLFGVKFRRGAERYGSASRSTSVANARCHGFDGVGRAGGKGLAGPLHARQPACFSAAILAA